MLDTGREMKPPHLLCTEEPNPVISTSTERNQSMAHPSPWRAASSFSSSSWPLHILTSYLSNLCIFPLFYCILGVLLQHLKEFCPSSSHKLSFWHYYSLQPCKVMYSSWWKKLEHSLLPFSCHEEVKWIDWFFVTNNAKKEEEKQIKVCHRYEVEREEVKQSASSVAKRTVLYLQRQNIQFKKYIHRYRTFLRPSWCPRQHDDGDDGVGGKLSVCCLLFFPSTSIHLHIIVVAAAAVLMLCFGRPPFFLHSLYSRANPNFRSSRAFVFSWDLSLHYPDGQTDSLALLFLSTLSYLESSHVSIGLAGRMEL